MLRALTGPGSELVLRLLATRHVRPTIGLGGAALVGLLAVGAGLTHIAFVDGHPAEAIVPLLWVLAAIWAREDRVVLAGAVLGLSAGLELWGVLGVPVLLLAPRPRRALAGALVETAVVAGMFAPFALAGSAHMFQYDWRVSSGTLLSLFVGAETDSAATTAPS